MSAVREVDTDLVRRLVGHVAAWTGFDESAVRRDALASAIAPLLDEGLGPKDLLERAEAGEGSLVERLCRAAAVGESFFFRQPEHFRYVARELCPAWKEQRKAVRAWCAGCSTGEEVYSLAATLEQAGLEAFSVLGTDLVSAHVAHARAGSYGRWSVRAGGPLLSDPFEPGAGPDGSRQVRPALKERTEFRVHNLLRGPPEAARFDLVMCRNVLIYFSPAHSARVRASLAGALGEDGTLIFAAMDVAQPPPGLVRRGPPEQQVWGHETDEEAQARVVPLPVPRRRPPAPPRRRDPPPPAAPPVPEPAPEPAPFDPVSLHVRALLALERGEGAEADRLLADLRRLDPGYVPGLLEGALSCARDGRKGAAVALMREVLARALGLDSEQIIPGPEPLPARFYAAAARAWLDAELRR